MLLLFQTCMYKELLSQPVADRISVTVSANQSRSHWILSLWVWVSCVNILSVVCAWMHMCVCLWLLQLGCVCACRNGQMWGDVHFLMNSIWLEHLVSASILLWLSLLLVSHSGSLFCLFQWRPHGSNLAQLEIARITWPCPPVEPSNPITHPVASTAFSCQSCHLFFGPFWPELLPWNWPNDPA